MESNVMAEVVRWGSVWRNMFVRSVRKMIYDSNVIVTSHSCCQVKSRLSQLSVRTLVVIKLVTSSEPLSDSDLFVGSPRRITRRTWRPWTRRPPTWRRLSPPAPTSTPSWWRPSRRRRCYWWSTSPTSTSPRRQRVRQKHKVPFCIKYLGYTWRGRVSRGWLSWGWRDRPSDHRWSWRWWRGRACDQGRVQPPPAAPAAPAPCPR